MDTTNSNDEGEPSPRLLYYIVPFFSICFFIPSCRQALRKIEENMAIVAPDTAKPVAKTQPASPPKPAKKKKKIYLTFDDGPNKGTKNVLDISRQEEIPVTFFIVGEHVFASIDQAQTWDSLKMAKNIELCNHSYTHAHNRYEKFYSNPEKVVNDMERTRDSLLPDNNIVRTPGRNSWRIDSLHFTDIRKSKAAIDSLQKAGFTVLGWDLEWHYDHKTYALKNTADELINQIDSIFKHEKTMRKDNLVVLAHDQVYHKSADSMQLRDFIQKLKRKDEYELSLVSGYPGIAKDTLRDVASQ